MPLILPGTTIPDPIRAERDDIHLDIRIEQAGRILDLSGWVQAGAEGFDDPVMSPQIQRQAGSVGGTVTGVDLPPRRVSVDVLLWLDGGPEYLAARRLLGDVTSPLTDGRLTVTCRTGTTTSTRCIDGRRVSEQAVTLGRGTWGPDGWQLLTLSWDCPGVFWRELDGWVPASWAGSPTVGFFRDHFLPLDVTDSTILGDPTPVTVPGNVPATPTWVIDGPGTSLTVDHVQTGRSWTLDLTGLTRPVTVNTTPGLAGITDGTGTALGLLPLDAPYDLWPIPPGDQDVLVTVTGATDDTSITATADGLFWRAFS